MLRPSRQTRLKGSALYRILFSWDETLLYSNSTSSWRNKSSWAHALDTNVIVAWVAKTGYSGRVG